MSAQNTCFIIRRVSLYTLLITIFFAAGCSTSKPAEDPQLIMARNMQQQAITDMQEDSAEEWSVRDENEVAPGYTLEITNSADSAINGAYQVNAEGNLELPYDIRVKAEGLSIEELQKQLGSAYSQYLRNPSFKVQVTKRDVFVDVRGLVTEPGSYLVDEDSSLDELIAKAKGLQTNEESKAVARFARITQLGNTRVVNLRDYFSGTSNLIPTWQGGERIFFQNEGPKQFSNDRDYIQILGEIDSPGAYPYKDGSDILGYLTDAGGPTDRANLNKITLLSRRGNEVVQQDYSLNDVGNAGKINPGDTLIVQANNPTQLERQGGIAASFAAVLSSIGLIFLAL